MITQLKIYRNLDICLKTLFIFDLFTPLFQYKKWTSARVRPALGAGGACGDGHLGQFDQLRPKPKKREHSME